MAFTMGFMIGLLLISVFSGVLSYYFWERWTKDEHSGKKIFFAFFSFFSAGFLGLLGAIPTLSLSIYLAYSKRIKKTVETDVGRRSSDHDDDDTELIAG